MQCEFTFVRILKIPKNQARTIIYYNNYYYYYHYFFLFLKIILS